jgi:type IV pilus assembly protein PilM
MAMKIVKGRILPIGVDLGSSSVKLVQLREADGTHELIAAAAMDVPPECKGNFQARLDFCAGAIRKLLSSNGFKGRMCVLGIPAQETFVHHVKIPKAPAEQAPQAVLRELQGKLPFPARDAEVRHIVAGDVVGEGEPRQEVIVVAASRRSVSSQLAMARKARLEVAGMNVECCAIVDCFARLFRRATDQKRAILFIDIGQSTTQVALSHGSRLVFARNLTTAGEHLDEALARKTGVANEDASRLRRDITAMAEDDPVRQDLYAILLGPLELLADEVTQCLRYYEAVFRNHSIERAIFLGGQASDRRLCQLLAQRLNLPAQIGDPLVRMGTAPGGGTNVGLDRREPHPRWAVAVGLSLGGVQTA